MKLTIFLLVSIALWQTKFVRLSQIKTWPICYPSTVGGRVVRFLAKLLVRWLFHIWLIGRMKFASLDVNLGGSSRIIEILSI